MVSLHELLAGVVAASDTVAIADAILRELCALVPNVLFAVTTFEGPRALTIGESRARIGGTPIELVDHHAVYARSPVKWNRWAVDAADRRLRAIPVEPVPRDKLNGYWAIHDVREHRRVLVCEGQRALAMIGASVVDDRPPCDEAWALVEQRMGVGAHLLRTAWRIVQPVDGAASPAPEPCAYLAPDGVVLAASDGARRTSALHRAAARLRDGRRSPSRVLGDGGSTFELRPSTLLRDHGGFELHDRSPAPSAPNADLIDGLARGLTNQEVATLLGTTPRAVKKRLERLYARYGATNRRELLYFLQGEHRSGER